MVVLTTAFVEKECTRIQSTKSLTKGISKNHLRKITHLYMIDKFIDEIGDFSICTNLKVIYLQNNYITSIENLCFAVNLTHLYLQHNNLTKIQKLDSLVNLKTLFLGHNKINIIEGLENLNKLYELHVPNQKLAKGVSLIFDPRSINTLSIQLGVLNIAGNNISSLMPFRHFKNLHTLDAGYNCIDDMFNLTETIITLKALKELLLYENPIVHRYRYRENLIANSDSLVNLDGKLIPEETRRFLKKFKIEKASRLTRNARTSLSDQITTSLKLPPAFERSVSRAILQQQSGPTFSMNAISSTGEINPQIYPAWKSAASIVGMRERHFTPRPLWKGTIKAKHVHSIVNTSDDTVFPTLRTQNKSVIIFSEKQ